MDTTPAASQPPRPQDVAPAARGGRAEPPSLLTVLMRWLRESCTSEQRLDLLARLGVETDDPTEAGRIAFLGLTLSRRAAVDPEVRRVVRDAMRAEAAEPGHR